MSADNTKKTFRKEFRKAAETFGTNFTSVLDQLAQHPGLLMRLVSSAQTNSVRRCNYEESSFVANLGVAQSYPSQNSRNGWLLRADIAPWNNVFKAVGEQIDTSAPKIATYLQSKIPVPSP